MRLVSFNVLKFRSIKTAHKIRVGSRTILVGPNNEGKSNLIRALATAMRVLTKIRANPGLLQSRYIPRVIFRTLYDWERDYPVELQDAEPNGESVITLEFKLSPDEIAEFRETIKSDLDGTLPLKVSLGARDALSIKVTKPGRGAKALTAKSVQIARFVSQRLNFEHIQAVRTASAAQRIVSEMVERELEGIESEPGFEEALQAIEAIQQPVLDQLSGSIKQTLAKFLPDVREVKVRIPRENRHRALRRACEIIVDDGSATLLEHKGDGVQSLAALGIMRHASENSALGRNLVLAIEEPESHLHPGAIHELRQVLDELSTRHQIVLTTHNPLFVDRSLLRNNVIVRDRKARPAQTVSELRDVLGVRASDNLRHAELVLLVEGSDDRLALTSLLSHYSTKVRDSLESTTLALEALEGATNLSYKASLIRQALCVVHAFLDDDAAGRQGFERARVQGVIADGEVNWSLCAGMAEAEVEDLYDPAIYRDMLQSVYRVSLDAPEFRSVKKWTERASSTFRRQGKRWDDRIKADVKAKIAALIAADPSQGFVIIEARCF